MICSHLKEQYVSYGAHILCAPCCSSLVKTYPKGTITLLTSGGYAPVHTGHISQIKDSKEFFIGGKLIVVVNSDNLLIKKHGKAFMPLNIRAEIMSAIRHIDIVIPWTPSDPADVTVCRPLEIIRPNYFTKGGDRNSIENIPEWQICMDNGIKIISGLGDDKVWSSSNFLKDWTNG